MKKLLIKLLIVIGAGILYLFIGVIASYIKQPEISEKYSNSFNLEEYYSDKISCDRAYVVEDNSAALIERLRMIERAEERILLSTFEIRADNSGKAVVAALLNAAEKGIEVKVLVDGFSAALQMNNNEYFMALSANDNVEIKIYNPVNLLKPWRSMGRLHDKYMIVDDELYILGGRNTFDYFLGDNGYKNYDRDLLVYNTEPDNSKSSLYDLEDYFYTVWKLKECKPFKGAERKADIKKAAKAGLELESIYYKNRKEYNLSEDFDYRASTYEVNNISILTNPIHVYSKEPTVFYCLIQLMKNADRDVNIHTPYIIFNDYMYEQITAVCNRNTKVRIMTNSAANNGNPFGISDYLIHRDKILNTGISLYEYEGGISYHGKSILIDDNISIIGSFNMDIRSAYLDTEIMLVVDSKDVNRQLKEYMESYEAEAVYVIDKDTEIVPEGVVRQELTPKKKVLTKIISLFNWLRFLM